VTAAPTFAALADIVAFTLYSGEALRFSSSVSARFCASVSGPFPTS
jgi:hypothetical protein